MKSNYPENLQRMRHFRTFLGTYNRKRFTEFINQNKNDIHILTGILLGHCKLNRLLSRFGIAKKSECKCSSIHTSLLKQAALSLSKRIKTGRPAVKWQEQRTQNLLGHSVALPLSLHTYNFNSYCLFPTIGLLV